MATQYKVLDGCPVPKPLYPILRKLKSDVPGLTYNSLYRGEDAAKLLHRYGKHTQSELYEMYLRGEGYPANPPGIGTHVLRGDGTVGYYGEQLKWWQCGIDVDDAYVDRLIRAAKKHGWILYRPYLTGSELHHVNFKIRPARWKLFFLHFWPKRKRKHHVSR